MTQERWDAIVVGGGPAGAAAALALARAGRRVTMVTRDERTPGRPAEILSPAACARLAEAGLPEPASGFSPCDGILSRWADGEPALTDYLFTQAARGMAVRRPALHDGFRETLGHAGVRVAVAAGTGARLAADRKDVAWREAGGGERRVAADIALIAAGRSSPASNESHGGRSHETGAIALWFDFIPRGRESLLLVEAAPGGWWYVPPAIDGRSHLVFVTDTDLLPREPPAQVALLERAFAATELVREAAAEPPRFERLGGMDARAGIHRRLSWETGARIGDAALALDPLSGSGIARAIEGGLLAARTYLAAGAIGQTYADNVLAMRAQEQSQREHHFAAAAPRFPDCPFWKRRRAR